jgi:hypothetical protein
VHTITINLSSSEDTIQVLDTGAIQDIFDCILLHENMKDVQVISENKGWKVLTETQSNSPTCIIRTLPPPPLSTCQTKTSLLETLFIHLPLVRLSIQGHSQHFPSLKYLDVIARACDFLHGTFPQLDMCRFQGQSMSDMESFQAQIRMNRKLQYIEITTHSPDQFFHLWNSIVSSKLCAKELVINMHETCLSNEVIQRIVTEHEQRTEQHQYVNIEDIYFCVVPELSLSIYHHRHRRERAAGMPHLLFSVPTWTKMLGIETMTMTKRKKLIIRTVLPVKIQSNTEADFFNFQNKVHLEFPFSPMIVYSFLSI